MAALALDGLTIEILNWDQYNGRKDLKATSWLRLQNSLFEDPNFFDFTASELLSWIYILSLASKRQNGIVRVNLSHAEKVGRLKRADLTSAIEKLVELQCVQITSSSPYVDDTRTTRGRNVDVTCTSHYERTNERDERTERDGAATPEPEREQPVVESKSVWEAYAFAYRKRYGADPIRNAKVNGQLKQFTARVPIDEGPLIAEFYLTHSDAFYVKQMHPVGLLLKDAEKLRTEWATNRRMTVSVARNEESKDHYRDQMERVLRGEL